MSQETLPTFFAPAERECAERVREQHDSLKRHFIAETLDALPVITVLLNRCRQIVLANAQAIAATGARGEAILGMRPGEAFGCIHASQGPGGCGTSRFCSRCGGVRSILQGLEGHKSVQDCSLLRMGDRGIEALDLQVSSSPITVENATYVLYCIQDLSDLKRRRTLERLFFHDMLNTVGGLRGLSDILAQEVPGHLTEDARFISATLSQLVEELLSQKDLLAAENNELAPEFILVSACAALQAAARIGTSLVEADGKAIRVDEGAADVEFLSDPTLLKRILGNMVKNALEASRPGDEILLSCGRGGERVAFTVHNPATMSEDVRLSVFKRNFSTKGMGRGLGTYGMKLLAERYLAGTVSFTSTENEGTTFHLSLPMDPVREIRRPPAAPL